MNFAPIAGKSRRMQCLFSQLQARLIRPLTRKYVTCWSWTR